MTVAGLSAEDTLTPRPMSAPGQEIRILEVRRESSSDAAAVVGRVLRFGEPIEIYFRFPSQFAGLLAPTADVFLCGLLIPAMQAGARLASDLPVSPRLLRGQQRIQHIMSRWFPGALHAIEVAAPIRTVSPADRVPRAATFFSGGVDSFTTALTHLYEPLPGEPPLTHLVFMHGLEIPLHQALATDESEAGVRTVAAELGLECVVGVTNLRSFFNPSWGEHWCGTVLAATAQALSGGFTTFYIPSSGQVTSSYKWGSVPLIDESCSTETLEIVNDNPLSRAEKVHRVIARHDVALRNLRFCTANRGGPSNCGRCGKCLRTMVALEVAGVLPRVRLDVPPVVPPDFWKRYQSRNPQGASSTLEVAREVGGRPWLERGLERKIRRMGMRDGLFQFVSNSPLRHALPAFRQVRAALRAFGTKGSRR